MINDGILLYDAKEFKLAKPRKLLFKKIKEFAVKEYNVKFDFRNDFERCCYDLICRAYIEARYNPDFAVVKEELEYILERIGLLKEITKRICTEKIKSYDFLIGGQEACIEDCPEELITTHEECVDNYIPEND